VDVDRELEDLRLLRVEVETIFEMSPAGRIVRQNFPDRSAGPRAFFAGCAGGNLACVRFDVDDRTTGRVLELAAYEPPWSDFNSIPACVGKIAELLGVADEVVPALVYALPNQVNLELRATIITGDSAEGRQLIARLRDRGMPEHMVAAGFKSIADLWEPWCVALDGGEIASMCYAARLSEKGAEAGVYTFEQYRGRGLAAAVTAAWASLPALSDRALFYSTNRTNRSSQRVASRLGLRQIGASVSVG
jgi:GNAT acetyltransferase